MSEEVKIKKLFTKIKSLLTFSLIQFCARNPSIIDTASGYSRRLGWDEKKVTKSLEELASLNLLKKKKVGDDVFYMVREEWKDALRDWIKNEDISSKFFIAKEIFDSSEKEES